MLYVVSQLPSLHGQLATVDSVDARDQATRAELTRVFLRLALVHGEPAEVFTLQDWTAIVSGAAERHAGLAVLVVHGLLRMGGGGGGGK